MVFQNWPTSMKWESCVMRVYMSMLEPCKTRIQICKQIIFTFVLCFVFYCIQNCFHPIFRNDRRLATTEHPYSIVSPSFIVFSFFIIFFIAFLIFTDKHKSNYNFFFFICVIARHVSCPICRLCLSQQQQQQKNTVNDNNKSLSNTTNMHV